MASGVLTHFHFYQIATEALKTTGPIFDYLIIDEIQDLGPHMLAFARELVSETPDDITLCGDL